MHSADIREKVGRRLRTLKHRPAVRGGNGSGPSVAQARLAETLGPSWTLELSVGTGKGGRASGHPTHYKLDLANRAAMVAIEVDGLSHGLLTRAAQDRKKDAFLASRGWRVLRFSNAAVMERLEECVRTVLSTTSKST
jgi:hypothetical protein